MESESVLDDRKMRTIAGRRELPTPDFCCRAEYVKRKCLLAGRKTQPPKQFGEALMLAQRIIQVETVNGNTSPPEDGADLLR